MNCLLCLVDVKILTISIHPIGIFFQNSRSIIILLSEIMKTYLSLPGSFSDNEQSFILIIASVAICPVSVYAPTIGESSEL